MSTQNQHQFWTDIATPLGVLTLTAHERALTGLFFPGRGPARDEATRAPERFEQVIAQLDQYFNGMRRQFELEIDFSGGTAFQQAVWRELLTIPYGATVSYGQIAGRLGRLERVRAVGAANGANPISVIVPCHRVIGADGRLTGYGGGLHRKQALLDMEAAAGHGRHAVLELAPRQLTLI
ncbi:MAG TPA: methylated-DNA--[protein]-cysteine S-methyltransferase [Solirubrobacteraceae bacterium]|jgi:methylated-DNA-[protein]-cysteine S-methyltransferase|nr:methylated-DNA--[protein]-cysteine S-methyltransferase [Solirubrobacteraceae bacterium]